MQLFFSFLKLSLLALLFSTQLNAQEVEFFLSEETVEEDSFVTVELTTVNFNDILTMQGSFNWDPAVVAFVDVVGFNLPTLQSPMNHFGTTSTTAGILIFSWIEDTFEGHSIEDNTGLFSLRFKAVSNAGIQSTTIAFSDSPSVIEVSNASGIILDTESTPGSITVLGALSNLNQIKNGDLNLIAFPNPTNGNVKIDLGKTHSFIETRLTDAFGRLISVESNFNVNAIDVKVEGAAGVYFLELMNGAKEKTLIKVVKE